VPGAIFVGIDSAERSGVAVLRADRGRERLIHHATLTVRNAGDVERAVGELATHSPVLVAVEAPYIRANAATGLTLAVLLGRWRQELERRAIPTTTVLASTWQQGVLAGLCDRSSDRAQRKRAARLWARSTFGVDLPEDEADAAGIAAWALRRAAIARAA